MTFHVNPATGDPGVCHATKACPFGDSSEHFATQAEASHHWEQQMLKEPLPKFKRSLVLSDIDGTLVRSSLVLENAVTLHETGVVDLGSAAKHWRADQKNEDLIATLAENYRAALAGRTVAFVKAEETVERLLASNANFYSTLKRLIAHKAQGHEVILISGSPDFIVGPFAKKFGFKFHASTYHRDEEGRFTTEVSLMAGSAAKQAVVEELDLESFDHVTGLGDTASDLPLLAVADNSVLVDPTEHTLETLQKKEVRIDEIVRE